MSNKEVRDANDLEFEEHFRELKRRVLFCVGLFLALFFIGVGESGNIFKFITALGTDVGYSFIYLAPQEVLLNQFKLAGIFSLMCCAPVIIYEILTFVLPVFVNRGRAIRLMIICSLIALILFLAGALFSYEVLMPFILNFLNEAGEALGVVSQITVEKYIELFVTVITCVGVLFEMPLVCAFLGRLGMITPDSMKKGRGVAIVVIFIIAAVITPPDVISQCIVGIPMIGLYQISIIVVSILQKGRYGKECKGNP